MIQSVAPPRNFPLTALCLVGGILAGSCSDDGPSSPPGPPKLLNVWWVGDQRVHAWPPEMDATPQALPPYATRVELQFDRLLDGSKIEDVVDVAGVKQIRPKAEPPVKVERAGQVISAPFKFSVGYNSVAPPTIYVRVEPSFPSSTTVRFVLTRTEITGKAGEPMEGPDFIDFTTDRFFLEPPVGAPDGGTATQVTTSYKLPLVFNNLLTEDKATLSQFVRARAGTEEIPSRLAADPLTPRTVYLRPADCLRVWPAVTRIDVTIEGELPDVFGTPLGQTVMAGFTTGPAPAGAAGAGVCPDAGVTDGGSSGETAGVPDAGVDLPVD